MLLGLILSHHEKTSLPWSQVPYVNVATIISVLLIYSHSFLMRIKVGGKVKYFTTYNILHIRKAHADIETIIMKNKERKGNLITTIDIKPLVMRLIYYLKLYYSVFLYLENNFCVSFPEGQRSKTNN